MNCKLSNLSWKSRKANQADRIRHSTDNRGEKNHQARLSDERAREIVRFDKLGVSRARIAAFFRIDRHFVSAVVCGHSYAHATGAVPPGKRSRTGQRNPRAKLTNADAANVAVRRARGERVTDIARSLSVHRSTIKKLLRGETYGGIGKLLKRGTPDD